MDKQELYDKRKSDIIKIVWCVAALIILAASVIFVVSRTGGSGRGLDVSVYDASVSINDEKIPAYKIAEGGPYIVAEELPSVGLKADFTDDENISVYYTDRDDVEKSDLSGKSARPVDKDFYINSEKKKTALKQYSDSAKVIRQMYTVKKLHLISLYDLKSCGILEEVSGSTSTKIAMRTASELMPEIQSADAAYGANRRPVVKPGENTEPERYETDMPTIFLDAGHGKSSSLMSESEKTEYGWLKNDSGEWGEWRHWREGKYGADCLGNDGVAQEGDCWYAIENGDRETEPDINMQNCLSAKDRLEQMGYKVILSRDSSYENPSITKRINDARLCGADLYICLHSNAGGGSGSAYIKLSEKNDFYLQHGGDNGEYAKQGNILGKMINDKIVSSTSLEAYGSGSIDNEPYLILFQKSPMVCAYLEIGFFDNENDLEILNSQYKQIGLAIAEAVDEYCSSYIN